MDELGVLFESVRSEEKKLNTWCNIDNSKVYQAAPIDVFQKFSITSGIDEGQDVEVISKYIAQSENILELGAGDGRVLNLINQIGFCGKVVAVEREEKFCKLLREKNSKAGIAIIESDIVGLRLQEKFDLVLYLWCGFAEHSKEEQPSLLYQITNYLISGGILAIDLIHFTEPCNVEQNYCLKTDFGLLHRYFPRKEELMQVSSKLNLTLIEEFIYTSTSSGKKKIIYILRKN